MSHPEHELAAQRISKDTLASWRADLTEWAPPDIFSARVQNLKTLPTVRHIFFKQAGLTFLRDAWLGARVAMKLGADQIRLCPERRPDFEIKIGNEVRRYEATEADMPGRRRGNEPTAPDIQEDRVEEWRRRFEAIEPAVTAVVAKKIAKKYDANTRLLIYVNLGCYGAYLDEGVTVLAEATSSAKDTFSEVLALWEGNLYSFWSAGKYALQIWKHDDDLGEDDWSPDEIWSS